MKKKVILISGAAILCIILTLAVVFAFVLPNKPIHQFKKYLRENNYLCWDDVCIMQSDVKNDDKDVNETYTEVYRFNDYTFTAIWVSEDRSGNAFWQMEFIYDYKEDVVTMNQYVSADSVDAESPASSYLLNKDEELAYLNGKTVDSESDLSLKMLQFKKVMRDQLNEAGISLQDIIS